MSIELTGSVLEYTTGLVITLLLLIVLWSLFRIDKVHALPRCFAKTALICGTGLSAAPTAKRGVNITPLIVIPTRSLFIKKGSDNRSREYGLRVEGYSEFGP